MLILPQITFNPLTNPLFAVTAYTGNGSTQSIITGQNQSAGALDFIKRTDSAVTEMVVIDTARGGGKYFRTADYGVEIDFTSGKECAFLSNGIQVNSNGDGYTNTSGGAFAVFSWLEQAGYMDVVTYTGTGANRTVAHNLGLAPSLMIVKRRDSASAGGWPVYHASNTAAPATDCLFLNTTTGTIDDNTYWNDTQPTSSVFLLGVATDVNASGGTYVAYLFAEKAGKSKFGSYGGNGGTQSITGLGFSPKAVLIKNITGAASWKLLYKDGTGTYFLQPDDVSARTPATGAASLDSNGFSLLSAGTEINASSNTYIYSAWG